MEQMEQKEKGFSLVELLVVMAIMGILIGLAIGGLNIARRNSRDTTRKADLQNIRILIEDFYLTNKRYPLSTEISVSAANSELTLTEGSNSKSLTVEFGGTLSLVTDCSTLSDPSPEDGLEVCYEIDSGSTRPQSYVLETALESGGTFVAAVDE